MNRRGFIKTIATSTLTGLTALWLPVISNGPAPAQPQAFLTSQSLGRSFRGEPDGRLSESLDGGVHWEPVANFGSRCAILSISEAQPNLYLTIGVHANNFQLRSTDARTWYTVDPIPRA